MFLAVLALALPGFAAANGRTALPSARSIAGTVVLGGDVPASQAVPSIAVELKRSDAQQADLDAFLAAANTRGSSTYHQWLTPAQFAARFAPSADAITPVQAWLQSQGLQVQSVSAGGMRLLVSGSAGQVASAFAVRLRSVAASPAAVFVDGTPSVPSALAAVVSSVSGLDSTAAAVDPVTTLAAAVDANTTPILQADLAASTAEPDELFAALEQASAQGQTVLALHAAPAMLPARALSLAIAGDAPATDLTANTTPRPTWQAAPGLPSNNLRATPDAAVATDASALVSGLQTILTKSGGRLGEVAQVFYQLAPLTSVFSHADSSVATGTWIAADGLGTVNVVGLVKAWPYGTTAPDSSTISLSAHTVTHGSNITLTAVISGSKGTPTGTVTFTSAQGGNLGTSALDSTGTATYTTNTLAGGQYGFYGNYSGDNTYATSSTNVDTATINPEPAKVTGGVNGTPTVGSTLYALIYVSSPSGVGTPTGTVTVYPYGTNIGTQTFTGTLAPVAAGNAMASVAVPASNAGSFTFQANCTTDANFSCYAPASFSAVITKGTPTVTLAQSGTASAATLTATVVPPAGSNSSAATPTGQVQFLDGTTVLGNQTINSSGVATYTGPLGSGSTHSVSATYQGDSNFFTASSTATAGKVTPTATLTSAASTTATAASLSVTVAPPAGTTTIPTGSVEFLDGATILATQTLSSTGTATYTGALLSTSTTHALTAFYQGDTNFNSATSNTVNYTNGKITPTVVVVPSAGSTATAATLTATVSAPAGSTSTAVPTGTVQFLDGTTALATQTLSSTGTATYTGALSTTSTTHSITAVYSGDTVYSNATSPAVNVGSALIATTTGLTSSSGYSGPLGTSFSMIVTVTPASYAASGVGPTGSVTITDSVGGVVGTGTVSSGTATITLSTLTVGAHSLTASYSGDTNYAASSTTTPTVITVTPVTGALTATLSPTGSIPYGYNATISATVTASAGTAPPPGTITAVVSGNNGTYTATLSGTAGSGMSTASISFPVPPPGTYTITVSCNASLNCTPVTLRLTTTKGYTTTTITTLSPTSPQAGVPVSISATVANSGSGTGTYTYSGTVSFYANSKFLGTGTVGSGGVATASVTFTSTSALSVTAVYSGDTNWNGSTSAVQTVTPTPLPAAIALTANPQNGIVGQNITLMASVSSGDSDSTLVPSGTITFYDTYNGIVVNLGSATLLSNGLNTSYAQISTTGLQAGVHNITAVYSGDNIFLKTTSAGLQVNIGDFALSFVPGSLYISAGTTATATVIVSGVNSFSGMVALGCTPPPSTLTTCNISPSVVTTPGTATITITTTANTGALKPMQRPGGTTSRVLAAATLGGLLSLCFLRRRRRIGALLVVLIVATLMTGGCGLTTVDSTANSGGGSTGGTGGSGSGGTSNNGSPLGTFNFTVTAASVSSTSVNARHTYQLPVTIQ